MAFLLHHAPCALLWFAMLRLGHCQSYLYEACADFCAHVGWNAIGWANVCPLPTCPQCTSTGALPHSLFALARAYCVRICAIDWHLFPLLPSAELSFRVARCSLWWPLSLRTQPANCRADCARRWGCPIKGVSLREAVFSEGHSVNLTTATYFFVPLNSRLSSFFPKVIV